MTNIIILGIGRSGCKALKRFNEFSSDNVKYIAIDSDSAVLDTANASIKIIAEALGECLSKLETIFDDISLLFIAADIHDT